MGVEADVDVVVVGAGVVGLASARALAIAGLSALLLEAHDGFGEETSSRNSEVLHAGMYYPTGSLKATLCVESRRAIYQYCQARGIFANRLGKLIVAPHGADLAPLLALFERGQANDVEDLAMLDKAAIKKMEPDIVAEAALWSPPSGIFDSHSYMLALLGELEDHGGALVRRTPFARAERTDGLWHIYADDADKTEIKARFLVMSAGLSSSRLAANIEGYPADMIPQMHYGKGNYFRYQGKAPFTHLIYPMPGPTGLGIHVTPDGAGHARFGPDVTFVPAPEYTVDLSRKPDFVASIKAYWPQLDEALLTPDYVGIRPKVWGGVTGFEDFHLEGPERHGLEGLIALMGIDSPGLTSSFGLGALVAEKISAMNS